MEETSFFLLIQYELDLLNLILNTSFPNNLNTNPNGVIRKKNITIIIIGAINFPKTSPSFIHELFSGFKRIGFKKAIAKKINPITKDQVLIGIDPAIGHKPITVKTIKNNIPKLLLELFFDFI